MEEQLNPQPSPKKPFGKFGLIAGLAVAGAAVLGYLFMPKGPVPIEQGTSSVPPQEPVSDGVNDGYDSISADPEDGQAPADGNPAISSGLPVLAKYKDGSYTADGEYKSPGGPDTVTVTLALKDSQIIGSEFVGIPSNPTSKKWMSTFEANYKQYVVGKNLDEVNLTKVSGSSLTPIGFNEAVAKIRIQAAL